MCDVPELQRQAPAALRCMVAAQKTVEFAQVQLMGTVLPHCLARQRIHVLLVSVVLLRYFST